MQNTVMGSEKAVNLYPSPRCYFLDESILHGFYCENLKSHNTTYSYVRQPMYLLRVIFIKLDCHFAEIFLLLYTFSSWCNNV